MTGDQARAFAEAWAANWNARNVDAVLRHCAEGVVFSSPVALKITGRVTLRGRTALRAYWMRALQTHSSLRFALNRALWDSEKSELVIVYDREINVRPERGVEILTFSSENLILRGEAFYGAIPEPDQLS